MATVTKSKQTNNKKKKIKNVKTIEIISKNKYEKLEGRLKNQKSNSDISNAF